MSGQPIDKWWIDQYRGSRKKKAHRLTGEHLGYGNYATVCGESINVEYRYAVSPEYMKDNNIGYCKKCLGQIVSREEK